MVRLFCLLLLLLPMTANAAPPAVTAVAYHPQGKVVAFGVQDHVRLFDTARAMPLDGVQLSGRVTALAYNASGSLLAIASTQPGKAGVVGVFAVPNGERLEPSKQEPISAHKDAIYTMAFSPDGKTLATAGYDRVIHLWNVSEEGTISTAPRLTLKDHSDTVYGLSFHPDGKLLASASADRAVKVWDATTGKRLYTLSDATDWVYAVAWSHNKKHLAAAGVDKSIRVWEADANGGKLVNTAFAHEKPVWRIAYSPDDKTLYSVGEDHVVKSWDAEKLTETRVFATQPDTILDFALRPDGKQFALARFDGVGILIDPATAKVLAQALPVKPVPPAITTLSPLGGVRGKTTRVAVKGKSLDQVTGVTTSHPDVKVKIDPKLGMKELMLDVTIGNAVPLGLIQFVFESPGGKSTPITFAVDRFTSVPERGITDSAQRAMSLQLPTTVAGTIDRAGDVDYFRFSATTGEQIGVQVIANEIGSKLDPALVLTDENGNVIAEGGRTLGFVIRKAGTYALGVRDREYRGGSDFHYRLHVGNVPVITGVFPLAAQRGRTSSVHVTGVNLAPASSGLTTKVTVPANAKPGSRVPVSLNLPDVVGSASILVSEFPSVVIDPSVGGDLRVPGSADGIFIQPQKAQTVQFSAKKGERLIVEVLARRAGSPVDSVIEILDSTGKPVPLNTLRCTAKTSVTFRDHDSQGAGIRLDAWNELGVDDYLYVNGEVIRILELPKGPDDDCQFYQAGGQRLAFFGTTPTHHSFGEPMYKVEFHPPGTSFPPNGMPVFTLHYQNDDGGPGYGKDSRVFFDPPADGTYQVRIADAHGAFGPTYAFRVTVRPPQPDFTVSANVSGPSLLKSGAVPVNVTINRIDGDDGPVAVRLKNLPNGFSAPNTSIEAGQQSTTFALFGNADVALPVKPNVILVASTMIDGKEIAREIPLGLPGKLGTGDIITTVRQEAIEIRPGHETRFTVDIARQGTFAGRVPLDVRGLPHGVRVLNVGLNGILVTEREKSREVVLFAEPWVKPMERPVVIFARREGTAGEFAAKPVTLKVKK